MTAIYRRFDQVAEFLTRLPLIMLVLVALMGYRFYEVDTLFLRVLPADVPSRALASGLISAVFIFSTVIFMVHAYRIGWGVKVGLVLTALIINLYFWEVSSGDWIFKSFISTVIAAFDIGFAFLFHSIRIEQEHQITHDQLKREADKIKTEISDYNRSLRSLRSESESLSNFIKQHTCPHCEEIYPSPRSLNAHKPKCNHNPDKK